MTANKTIIITGASDGIGAAAARRLKADGHTVVVVGRSPDKTRAVAAELGADSYVADFSKLTDVRSLAARLLKKYPVIDVLANNAGGIFAERSVTDDGFEKTFQVNYLAPFLLTNLLMPTLINSGATVINTSSTAHYMGNLDLDDLGLERRFSKWRAYGNAKLEDLLFAREISRRYGGKGVSSASFHPGIVRTSFSRELSGPAKLIFDTPLSKLVGTVSPEQGADTLVWLARSTPRRDFVPGAYYVRRKKAHTSPAARDDELASELWNKSEELLGKEFRH